MCHIKVVLNVRLTVFRHVLYYTMCDVTDALEIHNYHYRATDFILNLVTYTRLVEIVL